MTIENKVVSLETAKRLKEAGFEMETEHYWVMTTVHQEKGFILVGTLEFNTWQGGHSVYSGYDDKDPIYEFFPAPDAQELGELLPEWFCTSKGGVAFLRRHSLTKEQLDDLTAHVLVPHIEERGEAEKRAACWLWLKENKLM